MKDLKVTKQQDITKITLTFEDGTTKDIDQGMIVSLTPKGDDEMTLGIECCHIYQKEYQNIMYGMLQLASETYVDSDEETEE